MVDAEKLMRQIKDLEMSSKSLQRQARKYEKEKKTEELKANKAIERGDEDGARIHAENSISNGHEQMNCLRLASRLDAIVAVCHHTESAGIIVQSLEAAFNSGNLQEFSETMDRVVLQCLIMGLQAAFVKMSMAGSTSEGEVNNLVQQLADGCSLEGPPQQAANGEEVDDDDLSKRRA